MLPKDQYYDQGSYVANEGPRGKGAVLPDSPPHSTESHKQLNHILCGVCRATPAPNGFRSPPVRAQRRRIPKSTTPYEYHTVSGLRQNEPEILHLEVLSL